MRTWRRARCAPGGAGHVVERGHECPQVGVVDVYDALFTKFGAARVDAVRPESREQAHDPALVANLLYASGLGALQLARVGILVKEAAPGIPTVGEISPTQVRDHLVATAFALAGCTATA